MDKNFFIIFGLFLILLVSVIAVETSGPITSGNVVWVDKNCEGCGTGAPWTVKQVGTSFNFGDGAKLSKDGYIGSNSDIQCTLVATDRDPGCCDGDDDVCAIKSWKSPGDLIDRDSGIPNAGFTKKLGGSDCTNPDDLIKVSKVHHPWICGDDKKFYQCDSSSAGEVLYEPTSDKSYQCVTGSTTESCGWGHTNCDANIYSDFPPNFAGPKPSGGACTPEPIGDDCSITSNCRVDKFCNVGANDIELVAIPDCEDWDYNCYSTKLECHKFEWEYDPSLGDVKKVIDNDAWSDLNYCDYRRTLPQNKWVEVDESNLEPKAGYPFACGDGINNDENFADANGNNILDSGEELIDCKDPACWGKPANKNSFGEIVYCAEKEKSEFSGANTFLNFRTCSDQYDNDDSGIEDIAEETCGAGEIIWTKCLPSGCTKSMILPIPISLIPLVTLDVNIVPNRAGLTFQSNYGYVERETFEVSCRDGKDNDADGLIDCEDPNCNLPAGEGGTKPSASDLSYCADFRKEACIDSAVGGKWRSAPNNFTYASSPSAAHQNMCCGNNPDIDRGFLAGSSGKFNQVCQSSSSDVWTWTAASNSFKQNQIFNGDDKLFEAISNPDHMFLCKADSYGGSKQGYSSAHYANLASSPTYQDVSSPFGTKSILQSLQLLPPVPGKKYNINHGVLVNQQDITANTGCTNGACGSDHFSDIVDVARVTSDLVATGIISSCDLDEDGFDVNPEYLASLTPKPAEYARCIRPLAPFENFDKIKCSENQDEDSRAYPGAVDLADGVDNDCDGVNNEDKNSVNLDKNLELLFDNKLVPNERFMCVNRGDAGVFLECTGHSLGYGRGIEENRRRQGGSAFSLLEFVQGEVSNGVLRFAANFIDAESLDEQAFFNVPETFLESHKQLSDFDYLEFSALITQGSQLNVELNDNPSFVVNNVFRFAITQPSSNKWVTIRIPKSEFNFGTNKISSLRFFTTAGQTISDSKFTVNGDKYDVLVALDKVKFSGGGKDRFCTGTYPLTWIDDLDDDTLISDSYHAGVTGIKNFQINGDPVLELSILGMSACNEIPGYKWTGTECCGDDGEENFVDSRGACVNSMPVATMFSLLPYNHNTDPTYANCGRNGDCGIAIEGYKELERIELLDSEQAVFTYATFSSEVKINASDTDVVATQTKFNEQEGAFNLEKNSVVRAEFARNNMLYIEGVDGRSAGNIYSCNVDETMYAGWIGSGSSDDQVKRSGSLIESHTKTNTDVFATSPICGVNTNGFLCDERLGWTSTGATSVKEITNIGDASSDEGAVGGAAQSKETVCDRSGQCSPVNFEDGVCCIGEIEAMGTLDSSEIDSGADCAVGAGESPEGEVLITTDPSLTCSPTDVRDGACCVGESEDSPDCKASLLACKTYEAVPISADKRDEIVPSLNIIRNGYFSKCEGFALAAGEDNYNLCSGNLPRFWDAGQLQSSLSFDGSLYLQVLEGGPASQKLSNSADEYSLSFNYKVESGDLIVTIGSETFGPFKDRVWTTFAQVIDLPQDTTIKIEVTGTNSIADIDNLFLQKSPQKMEIEPFDKNKGDWPGGCCPNGFCWDGASCISAKLHEQLPLLPAYGESLEDKKSGYRCVDVGTAPIVDAQWQFTEAKWDPLHKTRGFCAPDQCFKGTAADGFSPTTVTEFANSLKGIDLRSPEGVEKFINDLKAEGGLDFVDVSAAKLCADEGTLVTSLEAGLKTSQVESFYCNEGEWSSRTKGLSNVMLDMATTSNIASDEFSLFCDKAPISLNGNEVDGFLSYRSDKPVNNNIQEFFNEAADLADEYCVLDLDGRIFVGTSLGQEINKPRKVDGGFIPEFTLAIRNDKTYCDNIDFTNDDWQPCKNEDVWYNPLAKMTIFSFASEEASDEFNLNSLADLTPQGVFERVFEELGLLYDRLLNIIGLGMYEDVSGVKQFVKEAGTFDKLFVSQIDGKSIYGLKEIIANPKDRTAEPISILNVHYKNVKSPVCKSLDEDFNYQFEVKGYAVTKGVTDGISCEVLINSKDDFETIVYAQDVSRGFLFDKVDFEFNDLWRDLTSVTRLQSSPSETDVYKNKGNTAVSAFTVVDCNSNVFPGDSKDALNDVAIGDVICLDVAISDPSKVIGITFASDGLYNNILGKDLENEIKTKFTLTGANKKITARILFTDFTFKSIDSNAINVFNVPFMGVEKKSGGVDVKIEDNRNSPQVNYRTEVIFEYGINSPDETFICDYSPATLCEATYVGAPTRAKVIVRDDRGSSFEREFPLN